MSGWQLCMSGLPAFILLSTTTGVREMSNIEHVSVSVATHQGTHSPAVFRQPSRGKLHLWGSGVRMWFQRSRQRRALAELDDRLLRDIGLTCTQARREAAKPFWSAFNAKTTDLR